MRLVADDFVQLGFELIEVSKHEKESFEENCIIR